MNPSLHKPLEIELFSCNAEGDLNLRTLRMRYVSQGDWQTFIGTHVPVEAETAIRNNEVVSLHLDTLPVNGPESAALAGRPKFLVLGFQTREGALVPCVPRAIKRAFHRRFLVAIAVALLGMGMLAFGQWWVGALAVVVGSHLLRTAVSIARVPFQTYFTVSGS